MGTFTLTKSRFALLALAASLLLAMLGCNFNVGGPESPPTPFSSSGNPFGEFEGLFENATISGDGSFSVILNEAQMTALVAARLQLEDEPVITNPVVLLQDGAIHLYGQVGEGLVSADGLIVIEPVINSDGSLAFSVASADLGPLPVPDGLLASLSGMITEAFTGSIGPLATGIRLTAVAIDNGEMAIQGQVR